MTQGRNISLEEIAVHFDKHAASADHTIVINRVKPHTDFRGTWESGLMKVRPPLALCSCSVNEKRADRWLDVGR